MTHRTRTFVGFTAIAVVIGASTAALGSATATAAPAPTFTVNTTIDEASTQPFSGRCVTASGGCSVRAAIQAANVRPGSTIAIPAGHYTLALPPNPLTTNGPVIDPTRGDLDIAAPTTIEGAGADATILDGAGVDRVFMVTAVSTIRGLTVTGGVAREHEIPFYDTGGGGILNSSRLTLDHVTLSNNTSDFAGAIQNLPWSDMVMTNSLVTGNHANETGGVRCDNTCVISHTTITDNHVSNPHKWYLGRSQAGYGGGLDLRGFADVHVDNTTITGNSATDSAAGILIAPGYLDSLSNQRDPKLAHLYIRDSVVANNKVAGASGNCGIAFAGIVSQGGNKTDDATCGFAGVGDVTGPVPN
ncbi:hypothetical protein [Antrihabitans cavernicola]|uniref:Right handed beta helix domain-containing protein n=1 Tax=Antrihabitans cavernicola TaxID=2495913 RepID=A0A5A7SI56_9NOCA|nr:hypothetical protein [Spelaeibacter cavernicola]KAA0024407.1 hypothetical protein FOY51_00075 [Spelaeibacter cavernicola]